MGAPWFDVPGHEVEYQGNEPVATTVRLWGEPRILRHRFDIRLGLEDP
ncbi:hypothetical protein [Frondihabitans sp. VKM Ac-2883]|nr:hypothetical protein [Frondihabitans sp. VKM Ac-2883]MBF4577693.1 hypothetical protein [Frondihabitans sp. VKM Ac-2883]